MTARWGWVCAGAIALITFGYYALTWKTFAAFTVAIDHCDRPFCDFYAHYYAMAQEVFRSNLPTPGFFYSPFFAIMLAPFKPLEIDSALVVWGVFQALLVALLALAPRLFGVRSIPLLLLSLFLVLTAFPVVHNFKWGQVSVLLVLSLLACFYFYDRGKVIVAALFLAFAISLKFFPALFLAYFLFRRDWRFTIACVAASALFLVGIPLVAMGWEDVGRCYTVLQKNLGMAKGHVVDPNSQYFPNVIRRLGVAAAYDTSTPYHRMIQDSLRFQTGLRVAGYALAAANAALLYLVARRRDLASASTWGFVVVSLTLPLIVHTSWPHYFVYLPFCQVFLWRQIVRADAPTASRGLKIGLLVVPSVVASSVVLFNAMAGSGLDLQGSIQSRSVYPFWGCLLAANALLLAATYLELGRVFRRAQPS